MRELTTEFLELAQELMEEVIETPNAVWVSLSNNVVADASKPYEVSKPTKTEHPCFILFDRDDLEDRQFNRYHDKSEVVDGQINGYLLPIEGVTPKVKDVMIWNDEQFVVNAIDPIAPIDSVIIYFVEFGR